MKAFALGLVLIQRRKATRKLLNSERNRTINKFTTQQLCSVSLPYAVLNPVKLLMFKFLANEDNLLGG